MFPLWEVQYGLATTPSPNEIIARKGLWYFSLLAPLIFICQGCTPPPHGPRCRGNGSPSHKLETSGFTRVEWRHIPPPLLFGAILAPLWYLPLLWAQVRGQGSQAPQLDLGPVRCVSSGAIAELLSHEPHIGRDHCWVIDPWAFGRECILFVVLWAPYGLGLLLMPHERYVPYSSVK